MSTQWSIRRKEDDLSRMYSVRGTATSGREWRTLIRARTLALSPARIQPLFGDRYPTRLETSGAHRGGYRQLSPRHSPTQADVESLGFLKPLPGAQAPRIVAFEELGLNLRHGGSRLADLGID